MKQTIPKDKVKEILKEAADQHIAAPNLDLILDVPLQLTVELGRTKMTIRDLLRLREGSVVELSTSVGEPLDILVNQKPIAKGEVVVVNEKYGIRILSVISQIERLEQLK